MLPRRPMERREVFDVDAVNRLLQTLERILYSPIALAFGLLVGIGGMAVGFVVIWKIVKAHNETLSKGNQALEHIQVHTAVSTARQAEGVEAMRGGAEAMRAIVVQLTRLGGDLSNHDRDEEVRHRETLREFRDRPK